MLLAYKIVWECSSLWNFGRSLRMIGSFFKYLVIHQRWLSCSWSILSWETFHYWLNLLTSLFRFSVFFWLKFLILERIIGFFNRLYISNEWHNKKKKTCVPGINTTWSWYIGFNLLILLYLCYSVTEVYNFCSISISKQLFCKLIQVLFFFLYSRCFV